MGMWNILRATGDFESQLEYEESLLRNFKVGMPVKRAVQLTGNYGKETKQKRINRTEGRINPD